VEARATINGTSISKTFVAAVLVLVAMGLGAMGGYVVKGLGAGGASVTGTEQGQVHPAAGTVLHQDNPQAKAAELPGYIQAEIDRAAQATPRLSQDDPRFIQQYGAPAVGDTSAIRAIRGGTRGDHGELP
jgi:hypothetical protein